MASDLPSLPETAGSRAAPAGPERCPASAGIPALAGQRARFLTGLIGRNIQASRSPRMHEDEADAQGLRLVYTLFDFAVDGRDERDLPRLLDALQTAGFAGVNVTHPYKQAVIALLDELSEEATRIGAVNTVAFRNGRRIGFNTDVTGFAASFRRGLPNACIDQVVQIGAGGAGAATAHALLACGARRLTLFDTDAARATRLCDALAQAFGPDRAVVGDELHAAITAADGIINATPMGMAEHPGSPVPAALMRRNHWVADIVYFPLETELLRIARGIGCATLDGSGMAVFQAVGAFEIFTGRAADAERMERIFAAMGAA